jgi:GxxExxY protein
MTSRWKHGELTDQIIGAFFEVYNSLGYGFLEKVYEYALAHRLQQQGLAVAQQVPLNVYFDGVIVGQYFADVMVNDLVILELKATDAIADAHTAQLRNYLRATTCEVGLLLNFGPKAEFVRQVMDNTRKPHLKGTQSPAANREPN